MMDIRILVNPLMIFLIILLGLQGCATTNTTKQPLTPYSNEANAVIKMTDDNKYRVSLYSNQYPLPMGKIHSWIATIQYPDGTPVENAKVHIHGGMPAHQHGFPTRPRATHQGKGVYLIKGIKFSMPGAWEIRINIKEETRRDRAVFGINI